MDGGKWLEFCNSPEQEALVTAVKIEGLALAEYCKSRGLDYSNTRKKLRAVEMRASLGGYAPDSHMRSPVATGMFADRVSSMLDAEGNLKQQWVIAKQDKSEHARILLEAIESASEGLPKFKPTKPPKVADNDLLSLLTITDFHLGMKAWQASDGEDWDVTIARDVFLNSIHDMIEKSPHSGTGVLNQLGDFFHWDGLIPVTPTSRHVLIGVDDRYSKLVEMTICIMTEAVNMMLKKFAKVVVVQAEGNHDLSSSVWMRKYIKHRYADEPRVEVIDNEFPYYAYLHGKVMLGFHHGHKMRMGNLQKLFCSEPRFRSMWGASEFCYIHSGHLHHERVIEDGGAITEQHPTLATRDHHSSSHGYVSHRGAKIITYHKEHGEVQRVTVRPLDDSVSRKSA